MAEMICQLADNRRQAQRLYIGDDDRRKLSIHIPNDSIMCSCFVREGVRNGRVNVDRMDERNVESHHRLHKDQSWMRPLLR